MVERHISELNDAEIEAELAGRRQRRQIEANKSRPLVTEVLLKEGGEWIVWGANPARTDPDAVKKGSYHAVHAIKFTDGTIWDCAGGWRT